MFNEDDNDDEFNGDFLKGDVERFESSNGEGIGFLDSDRWEALIDHFLMNGSYKKVVDCADEAISQYSYNPHFKLRKSQAFLALGKLKDSINIISDLENIGFNSFELLITKATIFSQLKDTVNAIKYFREALDIAEPEEKDETFFDLAMEYQNNDQYQMAIDVLKEAIKINPKNEGAIYEIAYCYDNLKEYEKSIQCYLDFIDDNPYSFTAWYNLGNAYSRLDNNEKAIWAYDYCTIINDEFGPVYFNLGNAFLGIDKYQKAIEAFTRSIDLDGDDSITFCYIGECHEQLNELELAKLFYKRSLELTPSLPDAWLGLGIVKDLEGDTQEGIILITKAVELDPDNAGIYHVLAGAYEKLENFELADENYQLSLTLDPKDEECLMNYIQFLSEISLLEAIEFLNLFEQTTSDNEITPILRVNLLWMMGDKEHSIHLFKECLVNNREKAMELFDVNSSLNNVTEFVLLCE